jgi:predicted dehydrogenase
MSRALVVGHGRMGRFHARTLRDLGYDVTTVDPYVPADLAGLPSLGAYSMAAVATPPSHLPGIGLECATAGLRTLVEKPFAPTLQEAEQLADHLDGMEIAVGFIERFNPQVRKLRENLPRIGRPIHATFHRWNDRPTTDLLTDLRIHDIDLANYLELSCPIVFDTRADAPVKRRSITVVGDCGSVTVDLMDHTTSPLHCLWHRFLSGQPVPGPADAVAAHRVLSVHEEAIAA